MKKAVKIGMITIIALAWFTAGWWMSVLDWGEECQIAPGWGTPDRPHEHTPESIEMILENGIGPVPGWVWMYVERYEIDLNSVAVDSIKAMEYEDWCNQRTVLMEEYGQ